MSCQIIFMGGIGHCAARLSPVRDELNRIVRDSGAPPFELVDIQYPGFEGRREAVSWETFLQAVSQIVQTRAAQQPQNIIYATGVGALLAICLRSQDILLNVPIIMQGPALWGVERRREPEPLPINIMPALANSALSLPFVQSKIAKELFVRPINPQLVRRFFDGYQKCAARGNLSNWLNATLLRNLERQFIARPDALGKVSVWIGAKDTILTDEDVAWTNTKMGTSWPVKVFPDWGHYPMMDSAKAWVKEVADAAAVRPANIR